MTKDELLAAAVQAQKDYEQGKAELAARRAKAFKEAFLGPVSGREIACLLYTSDAADE